MVSTIRISIAVKKYSWPDFVTDVFDGFFAFYDRSVKLSRFVASAAKKFLVAVFIAEIVGIVLVFGSIAVLIGLGPLLK